jgi:hypothetical protein
MQAALIQVERAARLGPGKPLSPLELEAVYVEVGDYWQDSKSLSGMGRGLLKKIPWILFHPHSEPREWAIWWPGFFRAYMDHVKERRRRPRPFRALVHCLLKDYPFEIDAFDQMLAVFRQALAVCSSPRIAALKEACQAYKLLEMDGPRTVANRLMVNEPEAVLEMAGLDGELAQGRFMECVQREYLSLLSHQLHAGHATLADIQKALRFLVMDTEPPALRFASMRPGIAEALLTPFSQREADPEVQDMLREFLLAHVGDPRLAERLRWQRVSPDAQDVMLRWLVDIALEDFFRVLDRTAKDRHWKYRRKFWRAFREAGAMEHAWVALGPHARREAASYLSSSHKVYGELMGNVQGNHSVLLMRIGSLTICDWSHDGKCRIWKNGNRFAPMLYKGEYSRGGLMSGADYEFIHHGSEWGSWQNKVVDAIEAETGIELDFDDYVL